MVMSCVAYNCNNKKKKESNVTFHRFPRDEELRKKWIIAIKRKNFIPSNSSRLCSEHFTPDAYKMRPNASYHTLKRDAVPTLFNFPTHMLDPPRKVCSVLLQNQEDSQSLDENNSSTQSNFEDEPPDVQQCPAPSTSSVSETGYQAVAANGKTKSVSVANLSHPNSRKVRQLTKQVKKESARKKAKMSHQMKLNLMGEKFLWFQNNLSEDVLEMSHNDIASLIEKYLGRFDEELEQIQLKHSLGQRKNRQHASREDVIKLTKKQEEEEYNSSGIELPNLLLLGQVEFLRKWNGELRFLQQFKLRRFSREFLKRGCLKSRPSSPVDMKMTGQDASDSTQESNVDQDDLNKMCSIKKIKSSENKMEIDENK